MRRRLPYAESVPRGPRKGLRGRKLPTVELDPVNTGVRTAEIPVRAG